MKAWMWAGFGICLMGLIFFSIGYVIGANDAAFLETAAETDGVLLKDVQHGKTRISLRFTANGAAWQVPYDYEFGSMRHGENVTVYYRQDGAMRVSTPYTQAFAQLFQHVGEGIAAGGLLLFLIGYIGFSRRRSLLENGKRVEAEVTAVRVNRSVTVSGRGSPRVLYASYTDPDTRETFRYKSELLWGDPAQIDALKTVYVSIDTLNPKRGVIEIPKELARFSRRPAAPNV